MQTHLQYYVAQALLSSRQQFAGSTDPIFPGTLHPDLMATEVLQ